VVHPRQIVVIGNARCPIDALIPQILKMIPKMSESFLSRGVLE
jgi:hypothetical protein